MNGGASRRALSTSTRQPSNEVNRGDTWFVSRRERDIIPGTGAGWPEDEGLVDAHYGRLRRLCELLLGDRHEAEEVVQDAFMKAYEASAGPVVPRDWAAWLTRVTVNACRDRRRVEGELDGIRQVLVTTAEPRRLAAPSRRWSIAAMVTLSAAAVGALLWIEATAWKTLQPAPDAARAEQIAAVLVDVSAALFSVDGEPALALAESPVATALGQGGDTDPVCDGPLGDAECSDTLDGIEG